MKALPQLSDAVAYVLVTRREALDLSQEAFGEKADIERTYISKMERKIHMPSLRALVAISDVYGISASELVREMEEASAAGLKLPDERPRGRRKKLKQSSK